MIFLYFFLFSVFHLCCPQAIIEIFSTPNLANPSIANLTTGEVIYVSTDPSNTKFYIKKGFANQTLNSTIVQYTPTNSLTIGPVYGLQDGRFVLCWQKKKPSSSAGYPGYYQIFNNDMSTYGGETSVSVSPNPSKGDVGNLYPVTIGDDLLFLWTDNMIIYLDIHIDNGNGYISKYTSDQIISNGKSFNSFSYVAFNDGSLLIAQNEDNSQVIMLHKVISLNPVILGNPVNLTNEDPNGKQKQYPISVLMVNGNVMHAYYFYDPNTSVYMPFYKITTNNGTAITPETSITSDNNTSVVNILCLTNGRCVYFYMEIEANTFMYNLYFIIIAENGTMISGPIFATIINDFTIFPHETLDGFMLFYSSYPSITNKAIFFNSDGQPAYSAGTCPNSSICTTFINDCKTYNNDSTCQSCNNSKVLTVGKVGCAQMIANCSIYTDTLKCQTCGNSTNLTVHSYGCANSIDQCTAYSDDLKCQTCQFNHSLTISKTNCALNITNCSNYWDNMTCQSCTNNTQVTVGGLVCAPPIDNCTSYWDNKTCQTCNNSMAVTIGGMKCTVPIEDCVSYLDNDTCQTCNNSKIPFFQGNSCGLIIQNCLEYFSNVSCQTCNTSLVSNGLHTLCFNPIDDCQTYSMDNNTCDSCVNPKVVTETKVGCASPITSCLIYSDDKLCKTCNVSKVLTSNNSLCINSIQNCSNYTQDSLCGICNNSTILSINKLACANIIMDCLQYSDNKSCLVCNNSKILSATSFGCVEPIINCLSYADDGTCQSCIYGTQPTVNHFSCIAANLSDDQKKLTIYSQLSMNLSNISSDGKSLSKAKEHSLEIIYTNNSDYQLSLHNSRLLLVRSNSSIELVPKSIDNSTLGKLSLVLNLSNIVTDSFYFQFDIEFLKKSTNQSLPNYFILTYQSQDKYFMGSDEEIQAYQNMSTSDNEDNGFNKDLFAILFSIFVFLFILIVIVIVCICIKKKKNKNKIPPKDELEYKGINEIKSPNQPTEEVNNKVV